MEKRPYLSIVMNSRNDNYQGASFKRLQLAVSNLIEQAKRYNLNAELIIVDWNPPADKPLLKDVVSLPNDLGPLSVKFIVVPPSIHKKYNASAKINIVIPAAYNVGIRRAKGEFIMPTNSDVLFSEELMHFLSLEKLEKNQFYRAIRYEIPRETLNSSPLKEQMELWKTIIPKLNLKNQLSPHGLSNHPTLLTFCGADFLVFPSENWRLLHGYPEINHIGLAADELMCYMAYMSGLKEEVLKSPMQVYHIDHDSRWHTLGQSRLYRFLNDKIFHKLDENNKLRACARKIYRTKASISRFFMNFYFNIFIKYIEKHTSPEKLDFDIKYIGWRYQKVLKEMLKGKRPCAYSNDDWGFPKENFKEFIFSS